MSQRNDDRVDPWRLAEQNGSLQGFLPLKSMGRLAELLVNPTGKAGYVLRFGRDQRRRLVIEARVQANLQIQCQRCLEVMDLPVDAQVRLAVVQGEVEAEQLPGELEPLIRGQDEFLSISRLIEDELLLSIPVSPRHDGACGHLLEMEQALPEVEEPEKSNPFAMLAVLKSGASDS